ncbi:ubiquitin conjugation factor E4 [Annulohypoxylon maeteangense]|uniref:ubiquitin conjugation factor E4 n=1 Tax=Annulohypoxylon maeteangense TaxID=1927788 RepID=UPI0020081D4A|nr:ubiquitin conjugation factor E4 [Annulohypoxylon maeteangense]KAI0882637.1 ubiquitin conjugation factor E4 [Annulohypoxylon maeteangense]
MDPNENPPPTLPPQEQMRQKRLAKLGGLGGSPASTDSKPQEASKSGSVASNSTPVTPSNQSPTNQENTRPTPLPTRQSNPVVPQSQTVSSNPFSQLGTKNKTEIVKTSNGDSATPPSKKIHIGKEESLDDWTNRVLSDMFRVTLDETKTTDSRGFKSTYLPELRTELEQSGDPIKLTVASVESALLEAVQHLPTTKPILDYLLPCWKRVVRATKPPRPLPPEKEAVVNEAKRLCMSNCIFALTMPEYFSREPNPNHDTLVPYLLRHHDNEDGICMDFFVEATSRISEDETVASVFTDAMVAMSTKLATMTMNDDYKPYINCLVTFSKFPPLLNALVQHPRFRATATPGMTKEQVALLSETQTILGPFFRISPLQPEVTKVFFAGARSIAPNHIKSSQSALQMTLKAHQSDLVGIINAFVRASAASRNATLDWFAFALNTNHKRRALQVKATDVASDGFMVNLTAILDHLCQPFMDSTFSKVDKIDVDYLRRSPRVDMSDETKLNADQATADAFYKTHVAGSSNFISEIFFLTLAAHHYGLGATQSKLKDLDKDIKYVEGLIKKIEAEMPKLQNDPFRLPAARQHHENAVNTVEKYIALKHTIEGVVLDESMQTLSLQFMRYVSVWLLRVASAVDYRPAGGKEIRLPLPADKSDAFSCLPEYSIQDVVENFKFIFRFKPQILVSATGDEIITFCITFLRSSEYIKNPYLKSSLVTLLFSGTWPVYHLSKGILGDSLSSSSFANEHLLHALMKFYIECEHSGVSSAFYDRFNIRYEIFQVIKCIWDNSVYQEQLSRESKVNRQFFVQFVNLLLNDATYLLDEALTKLVKIHDYQIQLHQSQQTGLSPEDVEKIRTDLESAEQQCQSWMQLVNDTMSMMKLFTTTLRDAFTMPEIVHRLAGMLNYNLESLTGDKRSNLKVEDAKKYHFDAKALLSDFVDIYINLKTKPAFIDAVAADGRSYKPKNFQKTSVLLKEKFFKSKEVVDDWDSLCAQVADAKKRLDQAELDLGEIPDEFEDPLMGELMTDPVILPSQNIVDRSTIVQQLLSNPLDPFTRNPMTINDVVPADDLRNRIKEWKAERIAAAKAKVSGGDAMDTSED